MMVKIILTRIFKSKLTIDLWFTCMIFSLLMNTGCQKAELNVTEPKHGPISIQMRNFNVPLNGGTLDETAPDVYYFKQKEDGSYVFMLTYTHDGNFATNWATDYVLVHADKTGIIQKTEVMKLPSKDDITGTFDNVWDVPPSSLFPYKFSPLPLNRSTSGPSYIADDHGFLYFQPDWRCYCKDQFFNLNPETGSAEFISVGTAPAFARSFRTSDGGFISVGWEGSPDFSKYSKTGTLQFKQPMQYWEARPSFDFLTERNGDFFFIAIYNSGYSYYAYPNYRPYDPSINNGLLFENYSVNKAKSFFYLKESRIFNIEIRFGPGKKQKAHRFNRNNTYEDYVAVPFEVWDVKHNRQVMVSFRDQRGDGAFDLVPFNYDRRFENDDPAQSREMIWINGGGVDYAEIPDQFIGNKRFMQEDVPDFVWAYLPEGATWNPDALPSATFSLSGSHSRPGPQLIKVNANGSTVVKENFALGQGVRFKTLFKSVPYLDGFAVLINAPQVTNDPSDIHLGEFRYQPTQLVILDANFNQTNVIQVESRPDDYGHQLESNNNQFFYARITLNPNRKGGKTSLLLSTFLNGVEIKRYLDFDVEKYRITPTRKGGLAIVAWARPTDNTRDLLFMEFDENLKLITSHEN